MSSFEIQATQDILIESDSVTPGELQSMLSVLHSFHYLSIVEERAFQRRCGYPCCARCLPSGYEKEHRFRLHYPSRKVLDARDSEASHNMLYCSPSCRIASKVILATFDDTPIPLRRPSPSTGSMSRIISHGRVESVPPSLLANMRIVERNVSKRDEEADTPSHHTNETCDPAQEMQPDTSEDERKRARKEITSFSSTKEKASGVKSEECMMQHTVGGEDHGLLKESKDPSTMTDTMRDVTSDTGGSSARMKGRLERYDEWKKRNARGVRVISLSEANDSQQQRRISSDVETIRERSRPSSSSSSKPMVILRPYIIVWDVLTSWNTVLYRLAPEESTRVVDGVAVRREDGVGGREENREVVLPLESLHPRFARFQHVSRRLHIALRSIYRDFNMDGNSQVEQAIGDLLRSFSLTPPSHKLNARHWRLLGLVLLETLAGQDNPLGHTISEALHSQTSIAGQKPLERFLRKHDVADDEWAILRTALLGTSSKD